jgi:acyl-coenzyme A synthetase/AMP-(fatty) acid ligase
MTARRREDCAVAFRGDDLINWTQWRAHVGALREALAWPGTARWAVFIEDAYAFAVTLMAIWQAGGVAVVLPNGQPGTLIDGTAATRGLVTDIATLGPSRGAAIAALQPTTAVAWTPVTLSREHAAVELFTSGTTGDRKTVTKSIANLEDEVAGLERWKGAELGARQAIGTVSHQHIYGMLFRVLWPLGAGRPFRAEPLVYAEEMLTRLGPDRRAYLVTTPAHLQRLTAMRGAGTLGSRCRPFFCSGGPLVAPVAARVAETFGFAPLEVFGSTETGGVAWRQYTGDRLTAAWQPFDDVRVSTASPVGLHVISPRVSAPGAFTMADRARLLNHGTFLLEGRTDRVVKIAGKRVSLPEMEEQLLAHPYVAAAALTVIGAAGESRVGAAVVLSDMGRDRLGRAGRRAVSTELTTHLARYWERLLVPKVYRYLDRLPEDAQGKVVSGTLAALFDDANARAPWTPEIIDETTHGTTLIRRVRVPDATAFDGHFPGLAVVPGFVQIDWVMEAATRLSGHPVALRGLEAVKFRRLLRPQETIELRVTLGADHVGFRLVRDDGRVVSEGRGSLAEESP